MTVSLSLTAIGAISDYGTLIEQAADQIDRDDYTDKWPRFVQLVEAHMRRSLRVLDMETTVTLTASAETVTLPADFLSMRSIHIEGSPDRKLRGMAPAALVRDFSGASGIVQAYAQIANTLKLAPPPADTTSLEMTYLARFIPLTDAAPLNWILADHPDAYFYGILAQAYAYMPDPENASAYFTIFQGAVESIKAERAKDRWGAGPLVPNTVQQVRGARC